MTQHLTSPFFIPCEQGNLFAIYFTPYSANKSHCIIHIPAFAEEMNKSRHMVAMQASAFAEQGIAVLVLDLWGTGDSQGEFKEATWALWLDNIQSAVDWVCSQEFEKVSLWGLRVGVLLALDFMRLSNCNVEKLLAWQPVLNGETFIMQFLRLRVAAAMMYKNAPQEKTSELKRQLQEGQCIEVAGYQLNPELINPILSLKVQNLGLQCVKKLHLIEISAGAGLEASFPVAQWAKFLEQEAANFSLDIINGNFFWATQEITESPELIVLSSQRMAE